LFGDLKPGSSAVPLVSWVAFLGGWASCWLFVARKTKGFAVPMARASLYGAGSWVIVAVSGVIFSGRAVATSGAQSGAEQAGAAIGGGLMAMLTGGFSIFMMVVSLGAFLTFWLISRSNKEVDKEQRQMKRCPDCAEDVYIEAKNCRHCGYNFDLANKNQPLDHEQAKSTEEFAV